MLHVPFKPSRVLWRIAISSRLERHSPTWKSGIEGRGTHGVRRDVTWCDAWCSAVLRGVLGMY
jgi:hypothetical protein